MASPKNNKKTLIPITNQKSPSPSPSPSSFSLSSEENLIDEDDLELSLGIRSINYRAYSPAQITKIPFHRSLSEENTAFISKREVQALRRQEAKKKRDLKRKGSSGVNGEGADVGIDVSKIPRLNGSYWAPSSWWTWQNNDKIGGAGGGGQNGNVGSSMKNVDESISTGSSSGISDNNNYHSFSGPVALFGRMKGSRKIVKDNGKLVKGGNTSSADMMSHSSQTESQLTAQSNIQTPTNSPLQPEPQQQSSSSTPDITHFQTHLSSSSNHHSEQLTNSSEPSSKSPNSITSLEKSPSSTTQNSIPKEATGKPPRPNGQIKQQKTTLPQMPCVSVTGNGPNGKTITGILYKYTKTEVSIVCVCHGASFSPAGFVEHAGGVDVEHPLRHIRVVPFAL